MKMIFNTFLLLMPEPTWCCCVCWSFYAQDWTIAYSGYSVNLSPLIRMSARATHTTFLQPSLTWLHSLSLREGARVGWLGATQKFLCAHLHADQACPGWPGIHACWVTRRNTRHSRPFQDTTTTITTFYSTAATPPHSPIHKSKFGSIHYEYKSFKSSFWKTVLHYWVESLKIKEGFHYQSDISRRYLRPANFLAMKWFKSSRDE